MDKGNVCNNDDRCLSGDNINVDSSDDNEDRNVIVFCKLLVFTCMALRMTSAT